MMSIVAKMMASLILLGFWGIVSVGFVLLAYVAVTILGSSMRYKYCAKSHPTFCLDGAPFSQRRLRKEGKWLLFSIAATTLNSSSAI